MFVVFGQTATGKTAKAIDLAQKYNGELINADARQIYKHLTIVTGKDVPSNALFTLVETVNTCSIGYYSFVTKVGKSMRIWLYDIIDPKVPFSSAEYVYCAKRTMAILLSQGKTPILVGGTGMYLNHLLYGFADDTGEEPNWQLRKELENKSVQELQKLLEHKYPGVLQSLNESDRANPRRLIRRIEKLSAQIPSNRLPQRPLSHLVADTQIRFVPCFHQSPEVARAAIQKRVQERIQAGALREVQELMKKGYTETDPGLNAIGYRQLIAHLKGDISLEDAAQEWITKEVQYAKRQKTYFKKYLPFSNK